MLYAILNLYCVYYVCIDGQGRQDVSSAFLCVYSSPQCVSASASKSKTSKTTLCQESTATLLLLLHASLSLPPISPSRDKLNPDDFIGTCYLNMSQISVPGDKGNPSPLKLIPPPLPLPPTPPPPPTYTHLDIALPSRMCTNLWSLLYQHLRFTT